MKVSYSYGSILCVVLAIITDGHCDEDPETSTMPITTLESTAASILPGSDASSTLPESATPSIVSESAAISTLPEAVPSSDPGWWLGPAQFDNTSAGEKESTNENGTSTEEWELPPLIVIRYPIEGPPEILEGSFTQENGTYKFERENGNSTGEDEFDINYFNVTEFPFGGIDEEIMFDTMNGSGVWIEDIFVISEENVTEGNENKTGEVETTAPAGKENEQMETTVLPTANISSATGDGVTTEPQESTNLTSPIGEDTENTLPV